MNVFYIPSKASSYILEFKCRIAYISFSFVCAFMAAYCKATQLTYVFLLSFLSAAKHKDKSFIFTDVYEAFSSTISICLISSLFCVLPLILYHSICFFLPSWHLYEKKKQCKRIIVVFLCWVGYIYSIHSFFIPRLCSFLLQFQVQRGCLSITVEPKILSYVFWAAGILVIATFLFFFFYVFYMCVICGILDVKKCSRHRRAFMCMSLLLASFVSPPELWSQLWLTLFLFLLCEFLFLICFVRCYLYTNVASKAWLC